jgi:hypothetical protein
MLNPAGLIAEEEAPTRSVHVSVYNLIYLLSNDRLAGLAFFLCRAQTGRLFRQMKVAF